VGLAGNDGTGNSAAIITDFDPYEDQLLLEVHAADFDMPQGANALEINYILTQVDTALGSATLVTPSVDAAELQAELSYARVGYALLLGVQPAQISDDMVRVLVANEDTSGGLQKALSLAVCTLGIWPLGSCDVKRKSTLPCVSWAFCWQIRYLNASTI
jgi:hypothetical protein